MIGIATAQAQLGTVSSPLQLPFVMNLLCLSMRWLFVEPSFFQHVTLLSAPSPSFSIQQVLPIQKDLEDSIDALDRPLLLERLVQPLSVCHIAWGRPRAQIDVDFLADAQHSRGFVFYSHVVIPAFVVQAPELLLGVEGLSVETLHAAKLRSLVFDLAVRSYDHPARISGIIRKSD